MATPTTMIVSALIKIGEKPVGGTLNANEQTEYLQRLNQMLELWANDGLACYATQTDTKALTANDGTYTIGSGGDINVTWPTHIASAWTVDGSNVTRGIDIVGNDEWAEIMLKQLSGTYPSKLWYDNSYPLGTIYLWPLPISGLTLNIMSYQRLQSFALISTTVNLPPGYERAIIDNLAIDLAQGLTEPSATLVESAKKSLALLKKNHVEVPKLSVPGDRALPQQYQFPMPPW